MKTFASAKHPGWTVEHEFKFGRNEWTLTRAEYPRYCVSVFQSGNEYYAELLTQQFDGLTGRKGFETPKNAFEGTPAQVMAEMIRRGEYWKNKAAH